MRISLDSRAQRLLRRVSRANVYSGLELLLLSLLAIQCARLAWTIVTPVGPIGDWRPDSALRPAVPAGLLGLVSILSMRLRGHAVSGTDRLPLGTLMALAAWPIWLILAR